MNKQQKQKTADVPGRGPHPGKHQGMQMGGPGGMPMGQPGMQMGGPGGMPMGQPGMQMGGPGGIPIGGPGGMPMGQPGMGMPMGQPGMDMPHGGQATPQPPQQPQEPEKLTIYEIIMASFLILFIFNFFLGKSRNKSVANTWYNSNKEFFEENYAHVGTTTEYNTTGAAPLLNEGYNIYKFYASGRIYVKYMLVGMEVLIYV
jgi:hypothetical protein